MFTPGFLESNGCGLIGGGALCGLELGTGDSYSVVVRPLFSASVSVPGYFVPSALPHTLAIRNQLSTRLAPYPTCARPALPRLSS